MKKILITGANSFVGTSFEKYIKENYASQYLINTISLRDENWRNKSFSSYDSVYHVAGIAHSDSGKISLEKEKLYRSVNTDLTVEVAKKAKSDGVKQFIFMSSAIVYGESAPIGKRKVITKDTNPAPANCYGDSKLQAENGLRSLEDSNFKIVILRPPMIYGKGCKGNFPKLEVMARRFPFFPKINNERSMLYIGNLVEFVRLMIENEENGIFWPCNKEYSNTSEIVKMIAKAHGKRMPLIAGFGWTLKILSCFTGFVNKAFGNLVYAEGLGDYKDEYRRYSLEESIKQTVGYSTEDGDERNPKKHILVVSQYFYPETFRINDMCQEWVKRGYKVSVVTGIPNYPMGKTFAGYGLRKKRHEIWNGIEIHRIPLIPRGTGSIGMAMNYLSFMVSGIITGKFKRIKADIVFSFEVSPMTQVLTGISFAKRLKVPHFLYVQDLWPENVETVTGILNPIVIEPIDKMVDYIYKNTDHIFATSPSFVDAICNRKVRVDREKVHYWPQYAEEFYQPHEKKTVVEIPDDDSFKVIFTGNIGTAQGLQILPKTAELLKDENVKFVMVGDGRYLEEFNREVTRRNVVDKFIMVPRQPAERIPELLAACDTAFLSFQDAELWRMTIPAKLQSYMACGMPIIAAAHGETRRVITEAGCGVCSKIGDEAELSQKIKEMMNADLGTMGMRSREYFEKNFDKQMLMDQMDEYFCTAAETIKKRL